MVLELNEREENEQGARSGGGKEEDEGVGWRKGVESAQDLPPPRHMMENSVLFLCSIFCILEE